MKKKWKEAFTENLSYKLVSLFIALILWLTILGRRDFSLAKNIDIELLTSTSYSVAQQSSDSIKVKVSGPRTALKKFMDSGLSQLITVDISQLGTGDFDVEIPVNKIDVPFGVKIISVRPQSIRVKVLKRN